MHLKGSRSQVYLVKGTALLSLGLRKSPELLDRDTIIFASLGAAYPHVHRSSSLHWCLLLFMRNTRSEYVLLLDCFLNTTSFLH